MEERLTGSNTTLILVTHDRVFMEAVCTGILELDQGTAHLHSFGGPGSYNKFRQVCFQPAPYILRCLHDALQQDNRHGHNSQMLFVCNVSSS